MQNEGSKLLGGGRPITLGGKDWIVRPVTVDGIFQFGEWARMHPVNEALDLIENRRTSGSPVPDILATMIIDAAVREGAAMSDARVAGLHYTLAGTQQLFWLHVNHMAGVTIGDVRAAVTLDNKNQAWLICAEVSNWTDPFSLKAKILGEDEPPSSDSGDEPSGTPSPAE
jgi:hypothetical protein